MSININDLGLATEDFRRLVQELSPRVNLISYYSMVSGLTTREIRIGKTSHTVFFKGMTIDGHVVIDYRRIYSGAYHQVWRVVV